MSAGATRRRAVAAILACLVALALAGCSPAATPSPEPSATPDPIPEASFTGGPASARLTQPEPATWDGGMCQRGPDDAWLALNIGFPNGTEYFGLVVGRSAYTPDATRAAKGGGTFGGDDAVITWRTGGSGVNVAPGGMVVEVAKDLSLGTFSGSLADGTPVQGSFAC